MGTRLAGGGGREVAKQQRNVLLENYTNTEKTLGFQTFRYSDVVILRSVVHLTILTPLLTCVLHARGVHHTRLSSIRYR